MANNCIITTKQVVRPEQIKITISNSSTSCTESADESQTLEHKSHTNETETLHCIKLDDLSEASVNISKQSNTSQPNNPSEEASGDGKLNSQTSVECMEGDFSLEDLYEKTDIEDPNYASSVGELEDASEAAQHNKDGAQSKSNFSMMAEDSKAAELSNANTLSKSNFENVTEDSNTTKRIDTDLQLDTEKKKQPEVIERGEAGLQLEPKSSKVSEDANIAEQEKDVSHTIGQGKNNSHGVEPLIENSHASDPSKDNSHALVLGKDGFHAVESRKDNSNAVEQGKDNSHAVEQSKDNSSAIEPRKAGLQLETNSEKVADEESDNIPMGEVHEKATSNFTEKTLEVTRSVSPLEPNITFNNIIKQVNFAKDDDTASPDGRTNDISTNETKRVSSPFEKDEELTRPLSSTSATSNNSRSPEQPRADDRDNLISPPPLHVSKSTVDALKYDNKSETVDAMEIELDDNSNSKAEETDVKQTMNELLSKTVAMVEDHPVAAVSTQRASPHVSPHHSDEEACELVLDAPSADETSDDEGSRDSHIAKRPRLASDAAGEGRLNHVRINLSSPANSITNLSR